MKLGVFSPVLAQMSFKEMVEYLSSIGVQQLEMGAGGYPGKDHFDPEVLLKDNSKIEEIKQILAAAEDAGIEYVIVEQDESADRDPLDAAKMSREYLKTLGV